MPLKLGSTTVGSLYLGSTKISEAYLGSTKVYSSAPPTPDNVLVFRFSDSTYDPSSLTTLTGATWTQVSSSPNVWKWDASSVITTDWTQAFYNKFKDSSNLVDIIDAGNLTTPITLGSSKSSPYPGMFKGNSFLRNVCKLNFPNATSAPQLFQSCNNLTLEGLSVPNVTSLQSAFNAGTNNAGYLVLTGSIETTSSLTNVKQMFQNQYGLISCPIFETSGVTDMSSMFYMNGRADHSRLSSVYLYHTESATDVSSMFSGCSLVASGALALYQQMSTQTTPPTTTANCFTDCGSGTVTGAAELAQIPASWGGTGA